MIGLRFYPLKSADVRGEGTRDAHLRMSAGEATCAATSRKLPPLISDHQSKTPIVTSRSLTVGTSSKRPPPVSDRDRFLGLTVNDFPLFLKLLVSDNLTHSLISMFAVCTMLLRLYEEL